MADNTAAESPVDVIPAAEPQTEAPALPSTDPAPSQPSPTAPPQVSAPTEVTTNNIVTAATVAPAAIGQPAAVEAPAPKPAVRRFQPRAVSLNFNDITKYLDELDSIGAVAKPEASLDILSLAATGINKKAAAIGKVLNIDTEIEDLSPFVESKIRVIEHLCTTCARLLQQSQDGVDARVYDSLVALLADIFHSELPTVRSMRAFFFFHIIPPVKYLVDEVKVITPHTRLMACKLIAAIEEEDSKAKGTTAQLPAISELLREVTAGTAEREALELKLYLLCAEKGSDSISASSAKRIDLLLPRLVATIGDMPVALLHSLLDLLIVSQVKNLEYVARCLARSLTDLLLSDDRISIIVSHLLKVSHIWQDAARVTVLAKLFELAKVLVHSNSNAKIESVLHEVVYKLITALTETVVARTNEKDLGWLSGLATRLIELVAISIERENDLSLVVDSFPSFLSVGSVTKPFTNPTDVELVLRRAFDFLACCLTSPHAGPLLKVGLPSMEDFIQRGLHPDFIGAADIVVKTLELGALFVRQKADDRVFRSFFLDHMVTSFAIPRGWESDLKAKQDLIHEILSFGFVCVQNKNMNRYKYFSWFMPPTYELIDKISLPSDSKGPVTTKTKILKDIVEICSKALQSGSDVDLLLRDGVPMIVQLFGEDPKSIGPMLRHTATKFETGGSYFLLLELKYSLDTAYAKYTWTNPAQIAGLFRALIEKGKRDWIKHFLHVCIPELGQDRYATVRVLLFSWLDKGLAVKDLIDFCAMIESIYGLFRKNNPAVTKITTTILETLDGYISRGEFTKQHISDLTETLSRVLLFKTLFAAEFEHNQDKPPDELMALFQSKFPEDVVQDGEMMLALTNLAERIEHSDYNRPKYMHVTAVAKKCLDVFFNYNLDKNPLKLGSGVTIPPARRLVARRKMLEDYVFEMPKNVELRAHLSALGFHEDLWVRDIAIRVEIDDKKNIDENFKSSLSNLYGEYIDIFKSLYPGMTAASINNVDVTLEKLFKEDHEQVLGLEELRSRRNAIIKLIDKKSKDHPRKTFIQNRKLTLLAREEELEADAEKQKVKEKLEPAQKRTYWIRFNSTFFNTVSTCGKHIVGCYAPNGDHAEKPIENALKANVKVIGLYEEDADRPGEPGLELENVEVLMADQGLYVYKIYSNGHPYDTSLVWIQFFKTLIESNYVPCIFVPHQFPTTRIYNLLESFISPQITGSILTTKDNFFEEAGVDSYYDFKAEKIKAGDIIIDEKNVSQIELVDVNVKTGLRSSTGRTRLKSSTGLRQVEKTRQQQAQHLAARKRAERDLIGVLLTSVMKKITTKFDSDEATKPLSVIAQACARLLSEYMTAYVESGERNVESLVIGVDLNQWNRKTKKSRVLTQADRELVITTMHDTIHAEIDGLCSETALLGLYTNNRRNFFELQRHIEKLIQNSKAPGGRAAPAAEGREVEPSHPLAAATAPVEASKTQELEYVNKLFDVKALQQQSLARAKVTSGLIKRILSAYQTSFVLGDIPRKHQEQSIKWIFGNEDRVWRERGGRPGEETLQTFLAFVRPAPALPSYQSTSALPAPTEAPAPAIAPEHPAQPARVDGCDPTPAPTAVARLDDGDDEEIEDESEKTTFQPDHYGKTPYGGLVTVASTPAESQAAVPPLNTVSLEVGIKTADPASISAQGSTLDVVAYSIGDWVSPDNFEIVTAWVHPRYRGLRIAVNHYITIAKLMELCNGRYMTFDVLQGTLDTIYNSSLVLRVLKMLGLYRLVVAKRKKSYANETSTGELEQYEKVTLDIRWAMWAFRWYERIMRFIKRLQDFIRRRKGGN